MQKKVWINRACLLVGLLVVGSAASAGCYVQIETDCCSISVTRPTTTGDCQDQITSNSTVTFYKNAAPNTPGKVTKVVTDPGPICEWDEHGGEGCIFLNHTDSECNPVRIVGAACIGGVSKP